MSEELPEKVVGQLSGASLREWKRTYDQISAARSMLADAQKHKRDLWEKVYDQRNLDPEKDYTLETETGEIKEQTAFDPN